MLKLGFHYHVPCKIDPNGNALVPGYLGVFIDGLANECESLTCFFHSPRNEKEGDECDYKICSSNVRIIDIGKHRNLIFRHILSFLYFFKFNSEITKLNAILVRGPTPLLPLVSFISSRKAKKLVFLIVGDYLKSFEAVKFRNVLKKYVLKCLYLLNFRLQNYFSKKAIRVSNNPLILKELEKKFGKSHEIRTTTLTKSDFRFEKIKCKNNETKIFYAGRIESGKGIDDILTALKGLVENGHNVKLDIAGWDPSNSQNYFNYLNQFILEKNLTKHVRFLGKKSVGKELLDCYALSDIFIMASTGNEGFPRTIWEAMSQRVPVIATTVGSIPSILTHNVDAILIEPGKPLAIQKAFENLIKSPNLQRSIVDNAFVLASTNTIEEQSKKLLSIIEGEKNQ